MAAEYDFSKGVRGRYAARFPAGTKVVVISPDVAQVFPDSASVNEALRRLMRAPARVTASRTAKGRKGAARVKGKRG